MVPVSGGGAERGEQPFKEGLLFWANLESKCKKLAKESLYNHTSLPAKGNLWPTRWCVLGTDWIHSLQGFTQR